MIVGVQMFFMIRAEGEKTKSTGTQKDKGDEL